MKLPWYVKLDKRWRRDCNGISVIDRCWILIVLTVILVGVNRFGFRVTPESTTEVLLIATLTALGALAGTFAIQRLINIMATRWWRDC